MKLGVCIRIEEELEERLAWAKESGFDYCQLQNYDMSLFNKEYAEYVKSMLDKYSMEATEFWCGWHGPIKWDLRDGPSVLGLVPPEYRASRTKNLLDGAAFARNLGIKNIITHLGFVPVNSDDPDYIGVVDTVKYIIEELTSYDQSFSLETGQEQPVVLCRLIEDVGSDRLFVNYDPCNLMTYGNGDPIAGLDLLGPYVDSVHAKDGSYPTGGYEKGRKYPVGEGYVDFPRFISKLKKIGFDGNISIENESEVSEEARKAEIIDAKNYLEKLWNK